MRAQPAPDVVHARPAPSGAGEHAFGGGRGRAGGAAAEHPRVGASPPDGHVRVQQYDQEGRITSRCYEYTGGLETRCYTASYDPVGNPVTMTDPEGTDTLTYVTVHASRLDQTVSSDGAGFPSMWARQAATI